METEGDYVHVRFRDPVRYEEIRTPDWAKDPAESVSEGSEIRTGGLEDGDDREVTSALISENVAGEKAEEQAREIVGKIESWPVRVASEPCSCGIPLQ